MFFLVAAKRSRFDKNPRREASPFKALLQKVSTYADVGLHPSYESTLNTSLLEEEMQFLTEALGRKTIKSRQHYLRLNLPKSYRALEASGIRHDYTMGYAEQTGFRTGTSMAYPFYDLELEQEMTLMVHPFCIMDGTLRDYQKLDSSASEIIIEKYISATKAMGGHFCILLHNETLSGIKRWAGWREMILRMNDKLNRPGI